MWVFESLRWRSSYTSFNPESFAESAYRTAVPTRALDLLKHEEGVGNGGGEEESNDIPDAELISVAGLVPNKSPRQVISHWTAAGNDEILARSYEDTGHWQEAAYTYMRCVLNLEHVLKTEPSLKDETLSKMELIIETLLLEPYFREVPFIEKEHFLQSMSEHGGYDIRERAFVHQVSGIHCLLSEDPRRAKDLFVLSTEFFVAYKNGLDKSGTPAPSWLNPAMHVNILYMESITRN